MAYKKSNPARTGLVMLMIVIGLIGLFQLLLFILCINLFSVHESYDEDEGIRTFWNMCGICVFWPMVLIYTATATSISLVGRSVYGKRHAIATGAGFGLMIAGVVSAVMVTPLIMMMTTEGYIAVPMGVTLPVILISLGLALFVKDLGGKIMGWIGAGVVTFSQVFLLISSISVFSRLEAWDYTEHTYTIRAWLIISMVALFLTMIGIILLLIGYVNAFSWTAKHRPLLDEEQSQQMQMQQQQMNIQVKQMQMQRQQLDLQHKTVKMIGNMGGQMIEEGGPREQIPKRSSAEVWEGEGDWG